MSAQNMKVTGHVVDTTGKRALANVSVLAVRIKDSLLLKYTRTNADGDFVLTNFKVDTFTLIVEHPELEPKSYFIFGNEGNNEINIPSIKMNMKTKDLDEVVIFANKNPIFYRYSCSTLYARY
jgi:5-hydroxyisourate hydrolase-like protein (transthyretin family)